MKLHKTYQILVVVLLAAFAFGACSDDETTARGDDWDLDNPIDMGSDEGQDLVMTPPDMGLPDVEFPREVVRIDTVVLSDTMRAGDTVLVACEFYDADDLPFNPPAADSLVVVAPSSSMIVEGHDLTAVEAGISTIQCRSNEYSVIDETPVEMTIEPGTVYSVTTQLSEHQIVAGETVDVSCQAHDAYGNSVDDAEFSLNVSPTTAGVTINDLSATITSAEIYEVSCTTTGATVEPSELLEVVPDLPASLAISVVPNESVYAIGQVVEMDYIVTDQYGNLIPNANVNVTSSPAGTPFGEGRFRFQQEGTYTLTASVSGPTHNGVVLRQSATVTVNSNGPSIECVSPGHGTMVDAAATSSLSFNGRVGDVNGISSVTVNGNGVSLNSDGTFSSSVPAGWGMNFVQVVARDTFGIENSRTCTFLVSDDWVSETGYLDDTIGLKLLRGAIDDGNPSDLDSLNDLLYTVLNSSGLLNQLDSALDAANPLKPNTCDQEVCLPIVGCACVFRSEVLYRGMTIDGPQSSELDLVTGGVRAVATARNINLRTTVNSTLLDTTGYVRVASLSVDITIDVRLVGGTPSASVRTVNAVNVGAIDLDFPGFSGLIIDILQVLFQGMIRDLLADTMRDFIQSAFNDVLDDVFSGLDVSTLGSTFTVPRIDGSGTVRIDFALKFSSLAMYATRAMFGMSSRFRPRTTREGAASLGVAYPAGPVGLNPLLTRSVGVSVHVGLFEQMLHALWRGGFFKDTLDPDSLGLPAGSVVKLDLALPPVVQLLTNKSAQLQLGAFKVSLVYPGIFDDGIDIDVGTLIKSDIALNGDDLSFTNFVIQQLYFSTESVSLDATTRGVLEGFLRDLLQSVVDSALNDALPALPIPGFELPASLAVYGLPAGRELGIVSPILSQLSRHILLSGNFGLR